MCMSILYLQSVDILCGLSIQRVASKQQTRTFNIIFNVAFTFNRKDSMTVYRFPFLQDLLTKFSRRAVDSRYLLCTLRSFPRTAPGGHKTHVGPLFGAVS